MNIFRRLGKIIDTVSSAYCYIGLTFNFLIGFAIVIDVILRRMGIGNPYVYFFGTVAIATLPFWTAAYGMRHGLHIRMAVLEDMMPPATRLYSKVFGYCMFLFFISICAAEQFPYFLQMAKSGEVFNVVSIPQWPFQFIVFFGLLLVLVQTVVEIIRIIPQIRATKDTGKRLWGKPYFILPVYAVVVAGCVWFFYVAPIVAAFTIIITFLFMAMPIAASVGFVTIIGFFRWGGLAYLAGIGPFMYNTMNDYTWLAFPLFVMGGFMMQRGMAAGLFKMVSSWVGWIPGGVAIATIWLGVVLGAMLGSIYATVATMVVLTLAELDSRHYPRELTLPLYSSAAILGYLIPPSISLVIYGVLTEQSIGALFMSGIGPGITLAIVFSVYVFLWALRNQKKYGITSSHATWKERFTSIPPNLLAVGVPVLVIGGIQTGIFTPTEAAAVALVYVFAVNLARGYTKFSIREFKAVFDSGANVISFMGILLVGALLSKYAMILFEAGKTIAGLAMVLGGSKLAIIGMMTLVLGLLGTIGEMFPVIIILIPTVFPVLYGMGVHPWWLCVYLVLMGGLDEISPPLGGVPFAVAGMAKVEPWFIFKHTVPWMIMYLIAIAILYLLPDIVTWIPLHTGFTQPPGF
jgi:C4-dicarboxylate transporter DctM subunit